MGPMDLTPSQEVAKEMLYDLVMKLRTAIDEGYLDSRTWEIHRHLIRARGNQNLKGGFSGEYKLEDLEMDIEFWLNPNVRNQLLGELGLPPYDLDQLSELLKLKDRPKKQKANRQRTATGLGTMSEQVGELIFAHPSCSPKICLTIYMILWWHASEGMVVGLSYSAITERYGIGRESIRDALDVLDELRLIERIRKTGDGGKGGAITTTNHYRMLAI